MPIRYPEADPSHAVFEGPCAPEEADTLLEWLRRTPGPAVDLRGCDDLHTAVVQLLLASNVSFVAPPNDTVLAACLGVGATAGKPITPPGNQVAVVHLLPKRKPRRGVAASPNHKSRT
jgi:hypothetical protein